MSIRYTSPMEVGPFREPTRTPAWQLSPVSPVRVAGTFSASVPGEVVSGWVSAAEVSEAEVPAAAPAVVSAAVSATVAPVFPEPQPARIAEAAIRAAITADTDFFIITFSFPSISSS